MHSRGLRANSAQVLEPPTARALHDDPQFITDNEPRLYIVDGVTMEAVAVLNLPIPKMPSVGLHNHFSKYPPSV